jgi:hypothetical protein
MVPIIPLSSDALFSPAIPGSDFLMFLTLDLYKSPLATDNNT